MSQSSPHALSTRLYIQAALTGLLAPTARSSTWMLLTFAIAGGAVAVAVMLRSAPANVKPLVVGFEGVAVAVGGIGLVSGHYIPGTIIGVVTLIMALNAPAHAPAGTAAGPWVPPTDPAVAGVAPQYAAPQHAAPGYAAPQYAAPTTDNPYAPPAEAPAPAWAPPAPVAAPEPQIPPEVAAVPARPAAAETPVLPPAAEPIVPPAPEDIPPATRSMTILPGA